MQRSIEQRQAPKRRSATRRHPTRASLRLHPAAMAVHLCAGRQLGVLRPVLRRLQAALALGADRLDARRPHRAGDQGCRHRHSAGRARHLHRRRAAARSDHVRRARAQTEFRGRHQQPLHSQYGRAVHPLFHRQCGVGALLPAGRGAHADYPHRSIPDGTRAVLGRLSLQSLYARLRLRHHLLSDRRPSISGSFSIWCSGSTWISEFTGPAANAARHRPARRTSARSASDCP